MTTITALPTAPSRTDSSTFSARSDALLGALDQFVTETNTVAGECVTNAATATTQAGLATTNGAAQVALATAQVALATTQASNAAISAAAAAGSALVAGAVVWVSGTTYAIGDTRYSPINFQTYRRTTSGAGTTDPSADSTNWTKALAVGITSVTTATTATTLTSTPTLLKITPASYGVAVTLPDATTCSVGGPLHIIDNKGAYPVRVLNSAGTLLGFVFAGVVSHVSLIDNSTAAGVWTVENSELVGASAQLLTTNINYLDAVIDLGSSRELVIGRQAASAIYAVVYDRSTNTFGTQTLVRTVSIMTSNLAACLSAANQVLVVSCTFNSTTFEAVTLSISGTTITVNTAATATLSANISAFADGCGLIAVGSSFVTSYTVATPAAQIRALSISGTTVTIGSAAVLDGTAGGLIALGDSTHVIAASTATTHLYTKPYTVSGSTLSAGTGTDTNAGSMILQKFAALGARWFVGYYNGSNMIGGVITLSGTTTTISNATFVNNGIADAIVIGPNKVLLLSDGTSNNANILTDTSGTASAGTAITLSSQTTRACLYASGTDAYVADTGSGYRVQKVDCSGASPVLISTCLTRGENNIGSMVSVSNSVLSKSADLVTSNLISQKIAGVTGGALNSVIRATGASIAIRPPLPFSAGTGYRGKADSERWVSDAVAVITKLECVV